MSLIDPSYYGVVAVAQPHGGATVQNNPENTTPISTAPPVGKLPLIQQTGFWLVALLALAVGLVHVYIRFS